MTKENKQVENIRAEITRKFVKGLTGENDFYGIRFNLPERLTWLHLPMELKKQEAEQIVNSINTIKEREMKTGIQKHTDKTGYTIYSLTYIFKTIKQAEYLDNKLNAPDPLKIVEEMYQEHEYALVKGYGENDAEPEPQPKWDINTLKEVLKRLKQDKEGK